MTIEYKALLAIICAYSSWFVKDYLENTDEESFQLIRTLKPQSFDILEEVPLFRFVCSPKSSRESTYSNKDQWIEFENIIPSGSVLLPLPISTLLFAENPMKRTILFLEVTLSDTLGHYVPYPILWLLSFPFRWLKLFFITLPMGFCAQVKKISDRMGNFILWLSTPLRWVVRKLWNMVLAVLIFTIWNPCKWCFSKLTPSKNRYQRLPGDDVETRVGEEKKMRRKEQRWESSNESPKVLAFNLKIASLVESAKQKENNGAMKGEDTRIEIDYGLKEFENSLKPSEEELANSQKQKNRHKELQKELEEAKRKYSDFKNRSYTSENEEDDEEQRKADEEFKKELEELKRQFDEKMQKLRDERAETEREAEEELRRIREDSQLKIHAFLKCIQLKMRFEEKEREWKNMLDGMRKPLVKVSISYYDLQKEIQNAIQNELEEWEVVDFKTSIKSFASKVSAAQDMLAQAFDYLKPLSEDYDDRIFIKIIMNSLSDLGFRCNKIGDMLLDAFKSPTPKILEELNESVPTLSPHSIPTTTSLRRDSQTAQPEQYANIHEPPYPDWVKSF